MVWESRALRLLTIFFCGPTIVTPTFFRSLVCEGERGGGGRSEATHTMRERDMTEGRWGKKRGKRVLVLEHVTPL